MKERNKVIDLTDNTDNLVIDLTDIDYRDIDLNNATFEQCKSLLKWYYGIKSNISLYNKMFNSNSIRNEEYRKLSTKEKRKIKSNEENVLKKLKEELDNRITELILKDFSLLDDNEVKYMYSKEFNLIESNCRSLDKQLEILNIKDAKEKIRKYVTNIYRKKGKISKDKEFTRSELANISAGYNNSYLEKCNRALYDEYRAKVAKNSLENKRKNITPEKRKLNSERSCKWHKQKYYEKKALLNEEISENSSIQGFKAALTVKGKTEEEKKVLLELYKNKDKLGLKGISISNITVL
jgi:hypothetical protein